MASGKAKLMGGRPITAEIAVEIRTAVFGTCTAPPRGDWTRTPLAFLPVDSDYPFGLVCVKNATRGLLSVVQAFVIKYLLFDKRAKEKSVPLDVMLRPNEDDQQVALWTSISNILWNIGEKQRAEVVLPGDTPHIPHSHTYFQDSVTEKLYMFEFTKLEDLQIFIKRYLHYFTEDPGPGTLLLLYCAIFTRGIDKMLADLDAPKGANLVGPSEEGALNVVTLLISGRATPYLHNGVVYVGDEDHYAMPQYGILGRAQVGLLIYEGENEHLKGNSRQPGSRLKTPATPVWVTASCGHYGVMFNSNRELLRNYHAEKRFELHYYTCAGSYISMTVNNQPQEDKGQGNEDDGGEAGEGNGKQNDSVVAFIEALVHCKWMEAKVIFHGQLPSNLNN